MRMGIGLGVGINRSNYAQGIFNAYSARVVADGGVVESGTCVDAVSSLLQSASLLLIPSGYKGGKLYAEIPTNGNGDLTWTRGGDAFRTNASGVLQRVPWNLVQQSETFSDAYWNKITSTITANTTTAPNGTLTADTLSVTTSTYSGLGRAITGVSANYNVSIYAKKNTKSWLYLIDVQGTGARAWFDLDNGVLGTVASGYTATITNVGDGWYRCTLSNNNAQALAYYQLGLADANNGITPTSSGSAFIWGAQLVEGTTAQTYLPTTDRLNFPRLSYMYGSCPSALLEPQRTNLALRSQEFDNSSWIKNGASVTANTTTSPDGETNADTVTSSASNGFVYQTFSASAATTYTFSVWVKAVSSNVTFELNLYSNGSGLTIATAIVTATGTWQRVSVTGTYALASANAWITIGGNSSFSTGETIYIYGAQLEQGSYPTTYIPTTSATATRVADSFSRSNIYTNGLISASGGTWFVELRGNLSYTRDALSTGLFIDTDANSYTNGINIRNAGGGSTRLVISKWILGMGLPLFTTTTDTVKIAIKWNGTTADIFANGTKVVSATSFTPTAMQFLKSIDNQVPTFIQQMALFPTPLSDTDCTTLTT